ncbi:hypothetical protein GQX74_012412 [Glossina fuscipes]|nr:hypothetical protein GQX74_012412 [Glossina fuscipes]
MDNRLNDMYDEEILANVAPETVKIRIEPEELKPGIEATIICDSSSSNPPAKLSWWKDGIPIEDGNGTLKALERGLCGKAGKVPKLLGCFEDLQCCQKAGVATCHKHVFIHKEIHIHLFIGHSEWRRPKPTPHTKQIFMLLSIDKHTAAVAAAAKSTAQLSSVIILAMFGVGINNTSKPGLWGGTVSTLEFKVNITQEMNGIVYTCQSANEALQRSVHEAISLDVLYRPKFVPPPSSTAVGVENESLMVALQANANPISIIYTWSKDGQSIADGNNEVEHRIFSDGPKLNFTKLHRNDAGVYVCEARNSQGSASINVTVVVEYGTNIKTVSENVIVNPGEDAMLSCTVEGKPLNEEHVKWERLGYDMTIKTSSTFANGTSYLHIKDSQREDVGNFRCIADNRVANPTSRDVLLIVKFAPEIDKSPTLLRAASGTGERGRLPCRAQASPRPKFVWRQEGKDLPVNRTYKYEVEEKKVDSLTYESILIIEKVAPADYGAYECLAKNELGHAVETVRLDITSQPDSPLSLNILNVTHDSVTVAWTPGFDGGLKASYRVRYREANREQYKYIDSLPNSHKLTITGLKMNTLYLFSVMAYNDLGESKYLPDLQKAHTKEAPPPSQPASSLGGPPTTSATPLGGTSGTLLLVGVASGVSIVLLNVFVIGCCLHKRNQKRLKRGTVP